jgi:hypothetical protein
MGDGGNVGLTRQTTTFIIVAALTSFINLLVTTFMFGVSGFFAYIIIFLFMLPFILLNSYSINCLSVGKCERWAWISSVLSMFYMIYLTILMILVATV